MRMRTKKWARPELHECPWYTDQPEKYAGIWHECFSRTLPFHVELGCGKGVSTSQMVRDEKDINFLVIDMADNVLGDTRRNIVRELGGDEPDNVRIAKYNIEYIERILTPKDSVSRIYINFCNPWTKRSRYEKRRLTHPRQLLKYRTFLKDGGDILFKTDDETLWKDSLVYFKVSGFDTVFLTDDLHSSGYAPNYMSEHEIMYSERGIPIHFGIFRKLPGDFDFDATRWKIPEE